MNNPPRAIQVTAAVISQNGRVLVARRPEGARHGGHWELPGGKQEAGETLAECLTREIREELRINIRVTGHCLSIHHDYGDSSIILHAFYCMGDGDELMSRLGDGLRLSPVEDLLNFDLLPPDREIAHLLNQGSSVELTIEK